MTIDFTIFLRPCTSGYLKKFQGFGLFFQPYGLEFWFHLPHIALHPSLHCKLFFWCDSNPLLLTFCFPFSSFFISVLLRWLLWVENFSHNDYCEQKQSIILLLVCFSFVAIVVISEKLLLHWLLWVKIKCCWNCWQLHYQGFCCITIIKFSVALLFSLWSSSWCSSKLSSGWSSYFASACFLSYPPCTFFFFLLDPYVPNRLPLPSPILCHWC